MEKFLTEKDCKNLIMRLILRDDKTMKVTDKVYRNYADFDRIFNTMPKGNSLKEDVVTIFSTSKKIKSFTLSKEFTKEDLENYKKFIKSSFEKIRKSKGNFYLMQSRKSGDKKLIISVEKDYI